MMSPLSHSIQSFCGLFLFISAFIKGTHGDCGPVPVRNFTLPIEGTSFPIGTLQVYSCDRSIGYYDIPGMSRTITCEDNSQWSQIPDFCQRACDTPPRLQYGELKQEFIDQNIFPVNTIVQYDCRPGYVRVPGRSPTVTCLPDFTWSNATEFCTRKSCGNPGEIENGEMVEAPDFLFGTRITYECNKGYRMLSKRPYRECRADGTWSNAPPECEAVVCTPPVAIANGRFQPEKEEYHYQDAVTFTCNNNLALVGQGNVFCRDDGTWSSESPTCIVVECEEPRVANAERLSGFIGPYNLDFSVTFKCKPGLTLIGSDTSKCNISSKWDPTLPQCVSHPPKTTPKPLPTTKDTQSTVPNAATPGTEKPDPKDDPSGNNTGLIVGLIVGGLGLCLIILFVGWYYKKNSGRKKSDTGNAHYTACTA
ncbi:complement decay-accelerating factor-like isoform 2-T2 [Discoglossus pictus]